MRISANSGCCVGVDCCAGNDLSAVFSFEAPLGQVIGYAVQQLVQVFTICCTFTTVNVYNLLCNSAVFN